MPLVVLNAKCHLLHQLPCAQENGEVACHASKLVFATAVQCINHKRKQQYKVDLAASEFKEDENLMAELEKQAQVEKDRYHFVLSRNIAYRAVVVQL